MTKFAILIGICWKIISNDNLVDGIVNGAASERVLHRARRARRNVMNTRTRLSCSLAITADYLNFLRIGSLRTAIVWVDNLEK